MKLFRSSLACVVYLSMLSTACAQVGKVTVDVTDYETGDALAGVIVRMGFETTHGMEAGRDNESECTTDSVGSCSDHRSAGVEYASGIFRGSRRPNHPDSRR